MQPLNQDVVLSWYDELSQKTTPNLKTTYHRGCDEESSAIVWIDNSTGDPDYFLEVNKPSHYYKND